MELNNNLVPKYYQIYEDIYREIRDEQYQEGDRLLSENALCAKYSSSRGTIREAIKILIQQGLLIRKQGIGTFVTFNKIEQDTRRLMGFSELMSQHNITATAKILEIITKLPSRRIQNLLKLNGEDKVTKIQRLRFGDEEPLIIERSYFVHRIFEPLLECDLANESIFSLLYRKTNCRLGIAQQSIEAAIAGPVESRLLKIDPGSPLLLMKRLISLRDDSYFQYSEDIYRSDRLKFTTQTLNYDETHINFNLSLGLTTDKLGKI